MSSGIAEFTSRVLLQRIAKITIQVPKTEAYPRRQETSDAIHHEIRGRLSSPEMIQNIIERKYPGCRVSVCFGNDIQITPWMYEDVEFTAEEVSDGTQEVQRQA
jgi:hypothetical protein